MAATKAKRRSTSKARRRAGSRRHTVMNRARRRSNPGRRHHTVRHHRRSNPAGYRWSDLFVLGGGAVVGSTLSSTGTQLILGASNSGAVGYVGNLVSTLVLSWLGGMVTRNRAFPAGILAGGIGALFKRIISDYSLFGGYTAQLGMGDYMVSNWVTPQRLMSDFRSLTEANMGQGNWGLQSAPPALAMSSSGVSTVGMGLEGDGGTGQGY